MENNDHDEKLQENDKETLKQNKENNKTSTGQVVKPSTSSNGEVEVNSLEKIREIAPNIWNKLAAKRQELQELKNKMECDIDLVTENHMRVVQALQTMGKKLNKFEINLCNEVLPNIVPKTNDDKDIVRPLKQRSKKELENLVWSLQELLYKLTLNDKNLKSKAENLAKNISGLNDFSVFPHYSSISGLQGQRLDLDKYSSREIFKKDSEKDQRKTKTKTDNKNDNLTPTEIFVNYINSIISKCLREQQQDKLEKYKCLSTHLDDLESYANELVEAGFGRIVEAEIRINRKNNRHAFITMSTDRETTEKDAVIFMPVARRYAFDGDIVRAFVTNSTATEDSSINKKPRKISSHIAGGNTSISLTEDEELLDEVDVDTDFSPESDIDEITDVLDTSMPIATGNCRRAFVIKIVKQTGQREIVGSISFMHTTNLNAKSYYKLRPHDMKVPMVYIPQEKCKEEIKSISNDDICGMLYVSRVLETDVNGHCIGELVQPIGKAGNLQAEMKAILLKNGFKDIKPYEQKFHEMFEGPMPTLKEEDLKNREDLRKKCIFTIDPLTAKDLDDAVSVEKVNDQEYEIGVHISDVSFYLQENSELDNLVKQRATSIYLVTEVLHMLPSSLCFRCSLLPGEDKLAFSVFWIWNTEKEEFSAPRFTRSLINSCSQFAYEHAQKIIDSPEEDFNIDDFPELYNNWTPRDIQWRVIILHNIAQKLRAKRYENGALSINNTKLRFLLNPKTGEPIDYEAEGRHEANFLIEEYMLLANQSVAQFIHDIFPDISILRNHGPPLQKSLKLLKERINNMGLEFDITSTKTIYESMQRLTSQSSDPKAMEAALSAILTKPMARARYYCSEGKTEDADFWHYALSIPIYTHFTSPIRRYPDILVHRLLAAALNYCPPPQRTTDELHCLAKICNDQKLNAKTAGEDSLELFFTRYIKVKQSITLKAVVIEISKHMVNVVIIETGHTISITYKLQNVLIDTTNAPSSITITDKNSAMSPLKIQLFTTLHIKLVLRNSKICGLFVAKPKKKKNSR